MAETSPTSGTSNIFNSRAVISHQLLAGIIESGMDDKFRSSSSNVLMDVAGQMAGIKIEMICQLGQGYIRQILLNVIQDGQAALVDSMIGIVLFMGKRIQQQED